MLTYDILQGWWTDAGTLESLFRANNLAGCVEIELSRNIKELT